jgi:hypothetical protein
MRRFISLGLVVAMGLVAVSADAATQCRDPKTKAFIKCPAAAAKPTTTTKKPLLPMLTKPATPAATKPATPATGGTKTLVCKTGVRCGNACIPKGKVCHK